MEEENNEHGGVTHEQIMDQLMPLRDRIVKIETIVDYHDKEFQTVKHSIATLNKTVDSHHDQTLLRLEQYNKNYMDVLYEQYRESAEISNKISSKIQDNRNNFESYVGKWKAVQAAVWFTICLTLATVAYGFKVAQEVGFFETHKIGEEIHIEYSPESKE
jgi:hypothetical protein